MKEISIKLSQKIIEFLQTEKQLEAKDIAKLAGTTPKFIASVIAGEKGFKQSHLDKIQAEYDVFTLMAPGLISELIAAKTKGSREFVVEKTKQGRNMLKKSSGALMQFICSMAAEHSDK